MKRIPGISYIIATLVLALTLAGCGTGSSPNTGSDPGRKPTADQENTGTKAFLQAEGLGGASYEDAEKVFSSGLVNPGHWEQTDTLTIGETEKALFSLTVSDVRDTYPAGAPCEPYLTFKQTKEQLKERRMPVGSLYFALPSEEEPSLSEQPVVLEYFLKDLGPGSAPVQLNCFSSENDGRTGSAEDKEGAEHTYFDTKGYFPQKVAKGDEIWLVLDLSDTEAESVQTRMIWKYAWVFEKEDASPEEEPEDHTDDPEYQKMEYPGRWDRTDIRYLGEDGGIAETDGSSVSMKRTGSDGREILFRCKDAERESLVRIPEPRLENLYYAGDSIFQEISIYCDPAEDDPSASVRCSLYLGDVSANDDGSIAEAVPKHYFTKGVSHEDVVGFSPHPHGDTMSWRNDLQRGYLQIDGVFPEGEEDGEKLYLVFEVTDDLTGECRMMNLYEYVWKKGPDTVWLNRRAMSD